MKLSNRIKFLGAPLLFLFPFLVFAAFGNLNQNISVVLDSGHNMTISADSSIDSVSLESEYLTVKLTPGTTFTISHDNQKVLNHNGASQYVASSVCNASQSLLKLSMDSNHPGPYVQITITPSSTSCGATGGGSGDGSSGPTDPPSGGGTGSGTGTGGGSGGGDGGAPQIPLPPTPPPPPESGGKVGDDGAGAGGGEGETEAGDSSVDRPAPPQGEIRIGQPAMIFTPEDGDIRDEVIVRTTDKVRDVLGIARQGDGGVKVKLLKKLLNLSPDTTIAIGQEVDSRSFETELFNPPTSVAVLKFQEKYGLNRRTTEKGGQLGSWPLVSEDGAFGSRELIKMNELYGDRLIGELFPIENERVVATLRPMREGDAAPAVKRLQELLNYNLEQNVSEDGPGSPTEETENYGRATLDAVRRFQDKYNLLPAKGDVVGFFPNFSGSGEFGYKELGKFRDELYPNLTVRELQAALRIEAAGPVEEEIPPTESMSDKFVQDGPISCSFDGEIVAGERKLITARFNSDVQISENVYHSWSLFADEQYWKNEDDFYGYGDDFIEDGELIDESGGLNPSRRGFALLRNSRNRPPDNLKESRVFVNFDNPGENFLFLTFFKATGGRSRFGVNTCKFDVKGGGNPPVGQSDDDEEEEVPPPQEEMFVVSDFKAIPSCDIGRNGGISLSWDGSATGAQYQIEATTNGPQSFKHTFFTRNESYEHAMPSTLQPLDRRWRYRVSKINPNSDGIGFSPGSDWTDYLFAIAPEGCGIVPPPPPQIVDLSQSCDGVGSRATRIVSARWSASTNARSFDIYVNKENGDILKSQRLTVPEFRFTLGEQNLNGLTFGVKENYPGGSTEFSERSFNYNGAACGSARVSFLQQSRKLGDVPINPDKKIAVEEEVVSVTSECSPDSLPMKGKSIDVTGRLQYPKGSAVVYDPNSLEWKWSGEAGFNSTTKMVGPETKLSGLLFNEAGKNRLDFVVNALPAGTAVSSGFCEFGVADMSPLDKPFPRDLVLGASGEDVRRVQRLLNLDVDTKIALSGNLSPGSESDQFTKEVRDAVKKFQSKHDVDNGIIDRTLLRFGKVSGKTRESFEQYYHQVVGAPVGQIFETKAEVEGIGFSWRLPDSINDDEISEFKLRFRKSVVATETVPDEWRELMIDKSDRSYTLFGLEPFASYDIEFAYLDQNGSAPKTFYATVAPISDTTKVFSGDIEFGKEIDVGGGIRIRFDEEYSPQKVDGGFFNRVRNFLRGSVVEAFLAAATSFKNSSSTTERIPAGGNRKRFKIYTNDKKVSGLTKVSIRTSGNYEVLSSFVSVGFGGLTDTTASSPEGLIPWTMFFEIDFSKISNFNPANIRVLEFPSGTGGRYGLIELQRKNDKIIYLNRATFSVDEKKNMVNIYGKFSPLADTSYHYIVVYGPSHQVDILDDKSSPLPVNRMFFTGSDDFFNQIVGSIKEVRSDIYASSGSLLPGWKPEARSVNLFNHKDLGEDYSGQAYLFSLPRPETSIALSFKEDYSRAFMKTTIAHEFIHAYQDGELYKEFSKVIFPFGFFREGLPLFISSFLMYPGGDIRPYNYDVYSSLDDVLPLRKEFNYSLGALLESIWRNYGLHNKNERTTFLRNLTLSKEHGYASDKIKKELAIFKPPINFDEAFGSFVEDNLFAEFFVRTLPNDDLFYRRLGVKDASTPEVDIKNSEIVENGFRQFYFSPMPGRYAAFPPALFDIEKDSDFFISFEGLSASSTKLLVYNMATREKLTCTPTFPCRAPVNAPMRILVGGFWTSLSIEEEAGDFKVLLYVEEKEKEEEEKKKDTAGGFSCEPNKLLAKCVYSLNTSSCKNPNWPQNEFPYGQDDDPGYFYTLAYVNEKIGNIIVPRVSRWYGHDMNAVGHKPLVNASSSLVYGALSQFKTKTTGEEAYNLCQGVPAWSYVRKQNVMKSECTYTCSKEPTPSDWGTWQ